MSHWHFLILTSVLLELSVGLLIFVVWRILRTRTQLKKLLSDEVIQSHDRITFLGEGRRDEILISVGRRRRQKKFWLNLQDITVKHGNVVLEYPEMEMVEADYIFVPIPQPQGWKGLIPDILRKQKAELCLMWQSVKKPLQSTTPSARPLHKQQLVLV